MRGEGKDVAALFIEERRTPPWHLADLSGAESAYSYVVLSTYHTCHIIQWLIAGVAQSLRVSTNLEFTRYFTRPESYYSQHNLSLLGPQESQMSWFRESRDSIAGGKDSLA